MQNIQLNKNEDSKNNTIYCEQIPQNYFLDAIKCKEICRMRILGRAERQSLKSALTDVEIISATGNKDYISRKQLMNNYRHISGHTIRIPRLRNNKRYYIMNICEIPYKIMKLPSNHKCVFMGKNVPNGMFLVAETDKDGNIKQDTLYPVSPNLFKKMFKVPMQPALAQALNGKPVTFQSQQTPLQPVINQPLNLQKPEQTLITNNRQMPNIKDIKITPEQQQRPQQQQQKQQNNNYKFTATHRIVSMQNRQLLGYVIRQLDTGVSKQLTIEQVIKLCKLHSVNNIMVVTNEKTGTPFLKGNGIILANLPEVLA